MEEDTGQIMFLMTKLLLSGMELNIVMEVMLLDTVVLVAHHKFYKPVSYKEAGFI